MKVHARALFRLRQKLQHDAAGAPAMTGAAGTRDEFFGDRETDPGGDLLGAQEIFMRRILERTAVERDQTLVAAGGAALIDGHREMALAEQRAGVGLAGGNGGLDALFAEARAGPHLAGRGEIHDQQANRPIGARSP